MKEHRRECNLFMNKKGFTLIEIIVCVAILSLIATSFVITISKNKKNESVSYTSLEKNILNAADVLVNMKKDENNNNYAQQLNLGGQGVEIKITKLIDEGLLDISVIDKIVEEQKNKGNEIKKNEVEKYYVLVLNGSLKKEDNNCQGLNYYLSWQKEIKDNWDKEITLYLCGNNPNESSNKKAKVEIKERNELDNYYSLKFDLKDESGSKITKNKDNTYDLEYAKKYYIEFTEDTINSNKNYISFDEYNKDNNFVYITLNNVEITEYNNKNNKNKENIVYYDISKYLKKEYLYLKDVLGRSYGSTREASILNYNNTSPSILNYKSSENDTDSIKIQKKYNFCYSTNYSYNQDTRKYKLTGNIECKKYTSGDSYFINKYTLKSKTKDTEDYTMYKLEDEISDEEFKGIEYDSIANEYDEGMFWDYDDDGKTYFYRGNEEYNYISFAGLLWRIVRVNGDESIRLILEGDIGSSNWNDSDNLNTSTEYTYSNSKKELDNWYTKKLKNVSNYDKLIVESIFCNDTTISSKYSYLDLSNNSYNRLANPYASRTPTLKCNEKSRYVGKIGLISADELAFAGASYGYSNNDYYLKYSKSFWTMTPYNKYSMFISNIYEPSKDSNYNGFFYTDSSGNIHQATTSEELEACASGELQCSSYSNDLYFAVNYNVFSFINVKEKSIPIYLYDGDANIVLRPVINLKKNTIIYETGDGSYGNPYVVNTNVIEE